MPLIHTKLPASFPLHPHYIGKPIEPVVYVCAFFCCSTVHTVIKMLASRSTAAAVTVSAPHVLARRASHSRRLHQAPPHRLPRRVVITGQGVVSPVGCTAADAWRNVLAGHCGIVALTDEPYAKLPCRIAARVPADQLQLDQHLTKSELKSMAPATAFAMVAAQQALAAAGWPSADADEERLQRTGVAVGMGMVDLADICETNRTLTERGYNRISPFFVPRILPNMAAGQITIRWGFRGPNHAVSTACATGVHAIGDSFRFVKYGDADVMVCGGAEACISPLAIAGFCRLRALCTSANEHPALASRPFDRQRDGFVMGEGSAVLVLEELEHARARGAPIIAEILGYGLSGDAAHLTSPRPDGLGARLAMERALAEAGVRADEVGYVNAHATSTPIGDAIETLALRTLFGEEHAGRVAVSSTKGAHGHLLGSAGNLEMVFAALACQTGDVPPTINLECASEEMGRMNFVPNVAQRWPAAVSGRRVALKNSFGFGGTNASLCVAQYME